MVLKFGELRLHLFGLLLCLLGLDPCLFELSIKPGSVSLEESPVVLHVSHQDALLFLEELDLPLGLSLLGLKLALSEIGLKARLFEGQTFLVCVKNLLLDFISFVLDGFSLAVLLLQFLAKVGDFILVGLPQFLEILTHLLGVEF